MRLADLLAAVPGHVLTGTADVEVTDIIFDSRKAAAGSLFVAVQGARADGNDFVESAVAGGARAVVSEREPADNRPPISWIRVPSVEDALWRLSHRLFGDPSSDLRLIGVTGTNGKTTTTHLIATILNHAQTKCAVAGTLGAKLDGQWVDLGHTTPMANDLARLMRRAVEAGYQAMAMEVSSHSLALHRVDGCRFEVGTYTNLTPEHLDFHSDMDSYFRAKSRLFGELAEQGGKRFVGVIGLDDPYGARMATEVRGRLVTYGRAEGDVRASDVQVSAQRIGLCVETPTGSREIEMPIGGAFNVMNGLAAAATTWAMGVPLDTIASALSRATAAPGRFESVPTGRGFSVIVDYAHSPDALEKLLEACRDLKPARLTVVFGCGGDRDSTKRPRMGGIAATLADRVVVTSDNPRTEDPGAIIESIINGMKPLAKAAVEVEPDRRRAIHLAIQDAQNGELVVIAGKGHEDYQIIGTEKIHMDDRELVREALG